MTGQETPEEGRSGLAGKALDMVEDTGAKVGSAIGDDHIVVKKTRKVWQYFLLYPAVFGALLGAIPTGINIYKSVKYGVSVSEVAHAEEQKSLWIKNIRCVQHLNYHSVTTEDGATVQIGACANGDVLIEVIPDGTVTPVAEWVSLNRIKAASSIGSILMSKAYAANLSKEFKVAAAASKIETVCTSINAKAQTIERIIKRDGKCMREVNNMITRKSIKRENVPCNTKCSPSK